MATIASHTRRLSSDTGRLLTAYVVSVGIGALLALAAMLRDGPLLRPAGPLILLVAAMIVSEILPMQVPWRNQHLQFSMSSTFGLTILFVYGPGTAALMQSLVWTGAFAARRKGWMRIVFNPGQIVLATGAAAFITNHAGFRTGLGYPLPAHLTNWDIIAMIAGVLAFLVVNLLLTSVPQAVSGGSPYGSVLKRSVVFEFPIETAALLLAPVLTALLANNTWLVVVTLIPMGGLYWATKISLKTAILEEEKREALLSQRATEVKLLESQRLDAIGRLAGGVAHDFNNLLSIIQNFTQFALDESHDNEGASSDLNEVLKASGRGAELVSQLLSFSRQSVVEPEVFDLNQATKETLRLVRRTIGEDIHIAERLWKDPVIVEMDQSQLSQVLLNLLVNARDAMPQGGSITLETHPAEPGTEHGLPRLVVRDSGSGMSEETLKRIFEPFFTTKPRGAGTGLGLATVYGIVQQAGGDIDVESTPGLGTTFDLRLPKGDPTHSPDYRKTEPTVVRPSGSATILVAEDEPAIRRLVERILGPQGFDVVMAEDAEEAMRIIEARAGDIDVLLTDVIMPTISGMDLAEAIGSANPRTKVIFMSGHDDKTLARHGVRNESYLQKPFTAEQLLDMVQKETAASV